MTSIHSKIANINIKPRNSASEYKELYNQVRDLAKEEDNGPYDGVFLAGEVWLQTKQDDQFSSVAFQRDEGYVGEHLSVYQSDLDENGKTTFTTGLRAEPTDRSERYLRFEHLVDTDGKLGYEEKDVVLVDTRTGTLFREG